MAAVLRAPDGRVLLARRPAGRAWAGYWEFPGGKVEAGEHPPQALRRELCEELGVGVTRLRPLIRFRCRGPEREIELDFWEGAIGLRQPSPREGQQLAWVEPRTLPQRRLLPANRPLATLLALGSIGSPRTVSCLHDGAHVRGLSGHMRPRTVLIELPQRLDAVSRAGLRRRIGDWQARDCAVLLALRRRAWMPQLMELPAAGWIVPHRRRAGHHGWLRAWGAPAGRSFDFELRGPGPAWCLPRIDSAAGLILATADAAARDR